MQTLHAAFFEEEESSSLESKLRAAAKTDFMWLRLSVQNVAFINQTAKVSEATTKFQKLAFCWFDSSHLKIF